MHAKAVKSKENKRQVIANEISQKQSGGGSTFQLIDNRPEAIMQSKLQDMANYSPQAKQAAQLQEMASNISIQQQPIQKKENTTGLPDNLKSGMEKLSGISLDDVKVHRNSDKPAQLQAHAYTQGTDIHIASGQEKHLPHEAWHVVQQKQGRVKPTRRMKGKVNVNDDVVLEKEADVMGERASMQRLRTSNDSFLLNSTAQKVSIHTHSEAENATINLKSIIQPKWIISEREQGKLQWDSVLNGNTWFYDPDSGLQYYIDGDEVKSTERTYEQWLESGFQGLKARVLEADAARDSPGINPRNETQREVFLKMRNEGIALFHSIVPGNIVRDNIWDINYRDTTEVELYGSSTGVMAQVKTGYQHSYIKRMQDHNAVGRYDNKFNLTTGEVTAIDNHRDPTEPLNNNEIFFQQLRMACLKAEKELNMKVLVRKNVVNKVLEPILRQMNGSFVCTPDNQNQELFYVLLATPNVKVALHMINDRGLLLGLNGISSVAVEGKNVTINFR